MNHLSTQAPHDSASHFHVVVFFSHSTEEMILGRNRNRKMLGKQERSRRDFSHLFDWTNQGDWVRSSPTSFVRHPLSSNFISWKLGLEMNAALRGTWQLTLSQVMFLPRYNRSFVMIHIFKLPVKRLKTNFQVFSCVHLTFFWVSFACLKQKTNSGHTKFLMEE